MFFLKKCSVSNPVTISTTSDYFERNNNGDIYFYAQSTVIEYTLNQEQAHWISALDSLPVSGSMLKAGTVLSLCIKPYVTFPLAPSSASSAWTCSTNVPSGLFSRTDALSLYSAHYKREKQRRKRKMYSKPNILIRVFTLVLGSVLGDQITSGQLKHIIVYTW